MPEIAEYPRESLTWEALCKDPNLHDLPYKIETNDRGQIVMSPVFSGHSFYQSEFVERFAEHLPEGRTAVELAIRTPKGTKVADVAWLSPPRAEQAKGQFDSPLAPEICVEVLSPTNTEREIDEKKQLYFASGAEEVWTCDDEGRVRFFDADGRRERSRLALDFPTRIEI